MDPVSGRRPQLQRAEPGPFIGMAGLACVLFLDIFAALFAPWYAVAALLVSWLVLFALGVRWWTPAPRRVVALPVVGLVLWAAVAATVVSA